MTVIIICQRLDLIGHNSIRSPSCRQSLARSANTRTLCQCCRFSNCRALPALFHLPTLYGRFCSLCSPLESWLASALAAFSQPKLKAEDLRQITPQVNNIISSVRQDIRLLTDVSGFNGWENIAAFENHAGLSKKSPAEGGAHRSHRRARLAALADCRGQNLLDPEVRACGSAPRERGAEMDRPDRSRGVCIQDDDLISCCISRPQFRATVVPKDRLQLLCVFRAPRPRSNRRR